MQSSFQLQVQKHASHLGKLILLANSLTWNSSIMRKVIFLTAHSEMTKSKRHRQRMYFFVNWQMFYWALRSISVLRRQAATLWWEETQVSMTIGHLCKRLKCVTSKKNSELPTSITFTPLYLYFFVSPLIAKLKFNSFHIMTLHNECLILP